MDVVSSGRLWHAVLRAHPTAAAATVARGAEPLRVVLLHGILQSCSCWLEVACALSLRGHEVLLLDWPHHGRSPTAAQIGIAMSADGFLLSLERLLAAVGWAHGPPLALAGCSLGGVLALKYACAHPARVARLTLVAPAGLSEPAWNLPFHVLSRLVGSLPHKLAELCRQTPTYGVSEEEVVAMAERLRPEGGLRVVVAGCDLVHTPHEAFWTSLVPPSNFSLHRLTSHWWLCSHLFGLRLHEEPGCWERSAAQPRSRL